MAAHNLRVCNYEIPPLNAFQVPESVSALAPQVDAAPPRLRSRTPSDRSGRDRPSMKDIIDTLPLLRYPEILELMRECHQELSHRNQ